MFNLVRLYAYTLSRRYIVRTNSNSKLWFSTNDCICGLIRCNQSLCPALNYHEWKGIQDNNSNLAPYLGSTWESIDEILLHVKKMFQDNRSLTLLDLGAGDGRVLIRAKQLGFNYVEGWELDVNIYNLAKQHILDSFQLDANSIQVKFGDARHSKPHEFDVITLFLLPPGIKIIESWLSPLLAADKNNHVDKCSPCVIASFGWPILTWDQHLLVKLVCKGGTLAYVYSVHFK